MDKSIKRDVLRGVIGKIQTRYGVKVCKSRILSSYDDCYEALYKVIDEIVTKDKLKDLAEIDKDLELVKAELKDCHNENRVLRKKMVDAIGQKTNKTFELALATEEVHQLKCKLIFYRILALLLLTSTAIICGIF